MFHLRIGWLLWRYLNTMIFQFRFATTRHKVLFTIGIICAAITGLLMPINQILSGLVANVYLTQPNVRLNNLRLLSFYSITKISTLKCAKADPAHYSFLSC